MTTNQVQVITPVSTKKTITIPSEIMIALGVHPRDNVLIELVDGVVRLKNAAQVNLMDYIPSEQLARSDNLRLPDGYEIEVQVQKVVKRVANSKRGL